MPTPRVSVLIPTFNRAPFVRQAVESMLNQNLRDLEVVVVDDGSSDATQRVLGSMDDSRARVIRHDVNRGIPAARNAALDAARGQYVAWLDSDDLARPTRLAEQVAFLEAHPDVAMVGACAGKLELNGARRRGTRVPPLTPGAISAWLMFRSAFQQSAVTGRADVLQRYRYDEAFGVCEDVELFLRLQRDHRLANLPRVLVDRRLHAGQTIRERRNEIQARKAEIFAPALDRLGVAATADDIRRHVLLGKARLDPSQIEGDFLDWARDWLLRIGSANRRSGLIDPGALSLASVYFVILACCAAAPALGLAKAAKVMARSRLSIGPASGEAAEWLRRAAPVWADRRSHRHG